VITKSIPRYDAINPVVLQAGFFMFFLKIPPSKAVSLQPAISDVSLYKTYKVKGVFSLYFDIRYSIT